MAKVSVFEKGVVSSHNVAPQTIQPVVRLNQDSGERELTVMRWGLVPWWSQEGKAGFNTINAKGGDVGSLLTVQLGHAAMPPNGRGE